MNKTRCLIVDDEPPAIELIEKYVSMVDQLEVVGTCHSAVKAFEVLDQKAVDLMFLDIRMPMLNGLDLIKTLKNPPPIILTTAYREYALDGYDLDIIDYLLKPIPFDRFLKAVDRYRSKTSTSPSQVESEQAKHIFFNVNRTQHKVELDMILYIESLKDYTRLQMTNSENLVVKGNLGTTLKLLRGAIMSNVNFFHGFYAFYALINEIEVCSAIKLFFSRNCYLGSSSFTFRSF